MMTSPAMTSAPLSKNISWIVPGTSVASCAPWIDASVPTELTADCQRAVVASPAVMMAVGNGMLSMNSFIFIRPNHCMASRPPKTSSVASSMIHMRFPNSTFFIDLCTCG